MEPLSQIIIVVLLAAYVFLLVRSGLNGKVVKISALVILLAGLFLYMYGLSMEGYSEGPVAIFFRSLVYSLRLFIFDNYLFEMMKAQYTPLFIDCFVLVQFAAILTSVSAVVTLIGKRARTRVVLTLRRRKFDHIFIGINRRSEMIASGLKGQEVAFIEFPNEEEEGGGVSIDSVLKNMMSSDSDKDSRIFSRFTFLKAKNVLSRTENTDRSVFERIGLRGLKRLIGPDTAFYILSDDSERNLCDLLSILDDKDMYANVIHTCVDREGLTESYKGVLSKTRAHFIYPSSLSVVELMTKPDCHPAYVMSKGGDAAATGEFNAMVVGFGETGQAATKFLYEFSSAVRPDGSVLPANIYVYDDNIDALKGHFVFSSPDIERDVVFFENGGPESGEFWSVLLQRISSLNYIVLSLPDDSKNLELACTIYSYAEKKRRNGLENFRIVVRKRYTPEYEQMLVKRLNEKAGREVIVCFGEYSKIFTVDMIVSRDRSGINGTATALADNLRKNYLEVAASPLPQEIEAGGTGLTYHEKRRLRASRHQYISRANHIPSKLLLLGSGSKDALTAAEMENLARCEHLRYCRYMLSHGYIYAPEDDYVLRTSSMLVPWEDLSEERKQYHRDMVAASFKQ